MPYENELEGLKEMNENCLEVYFILLFLSMKKMTLNVT